MDQEERWGRTGRRGGRGNDNIRIFVSNKKKRHFQYKQKIMVILLPSQINKKRTKHKYIKIVK